MQYRVDTDYLGQPRALISFMGIKGDIYPFLAPGVKKRINRFYGPEMDIKVPDKVIRQAFPFLWPQYLLAKRIVKKLPPHLLR